MAQLVSVGGLADRRGGACSSRFRAVEGLKWNQSDTRTLRSAVRSGGKLMDYRVYMLGAAALATGSIVGFVGALAPIL